MANELSKKPSHVATQWNGYYTTAYCLVGNDDGDVSDGALRFTNIQINKNQSINMAYLIYKYAATGDGDGDWFFDIYGIDEDNTGSFGNPFGRSKTTAKTEVRDLGSPIYPGSRTKSVKSILEEITSRSGWSSGNALGFILEDQGSDNDVYAACSPASTYLIYRTSPEPDFTPTPITKTAPTLPSAKDWGIKIAKPGTNVLTASEKDLYFTSRRNQFKVYQEGQITVGATGVYTITHNLGDVPVAEAFAESGSYRVRLPDIEFDGDQSPYGYLEITSTQLKIYAQSGTDVYYYIFLDSTN